MNLLLKAIGWVRAIDPVQPITMAPCQFDWGSPSSMSALDNFMFVHSDIISFHCFEDKNGIEKRIIDLKRCGRPMLCTEYMARPFQSTFSDILPVLKTHGVGAYMGDSWLGSRKHTAHGIPGNNHIQTNQPYGFMMSLALIENLMTKRKLNFNVI